MIVRPRPSFWQLFGIFRLSVLPRIRVQLVGVFALAASVVVFDHRVPGPLRNWGVAPFTLLGVALSIFLGFRNSACYERWWEARRQLGALIGEMRSLGRLAVSLPGERLRRERILHGGIAYVYALMAHLRGVPAPAVVIRYAPHSEGMQSLQNLPDGLLRAIGAECGAMLRDGEMGEVAFALWDARLTSFASFQVACERIRSTPTPFPYTLLLHRTAYAYCFLLPFGLAPTMGWGAPVFCTLVAYAFFGLDALGDELEEPFGRSLNALPLDAMARTVEISLLEAMGSVKVPLPLQPVDSVLS